MLKKPNKKAEAPMPVRALAEIIIAIALAISVFFIIRNTAMAGDIEGQTFNDLVTAIESPTFKSGESSSLTLQLDKNTAIIGFSSGKEDFICGKCPTQYRAGSISYNDHKMKKPDICKEYACVCLCKKGPIKGAEGYVCEKFDECKPVSNDLIKKIIVEKGSSIPGLKILNPTIYWQNGFIFGRNVDESVTGTKNNDRFRTVYLEKKYDETEKKDYIAVCNELPCIEEKENN